MVKEETEMKKARSFQLKKMLEITEKKAHSLILEGSNNNGDSDGNEDRKLRSQGARPSTVESIGSVFNRASDKGPVSRLSKEGRGGGGGNAQSKEKQGPSDLEQMKERFAKLLLGEDMSGGGKGVSSALALSNAITNLAASVFGEQKRLEPMAPDRKARWKKEVDWLLSVTDHIVEFVPSQQKSKDGTNMDIMVTQQRRDLLMNIPALRKLDAMLIGCLDNFGHQNEFWYVSRDANEAEQRDDKWWLPTVKVPPEGLSDASRKWLQFQKECVNQVLKASMAINSQILCEMEVPENYIESLPKNGRSSLGESIYKGITVESFNPEEFLQNMDLSTEHKVVDLKNRIEASQVIWKRKMNQKDGKSSWGSAVSLEKRELFEERAETILLLLKQRFPGISQSTLDISKIQYNKDVGHAVLESYSRVLESLANTVMSRIEDVLYADARTRDASLPSPIGKRSADPSAAPTEDGENPNASETPTSTSLADFMGWSEQSETDTKKMNSTGGLATNSKEDSEKLSKSSNSSSHKRFSYMEKLEILSALKSPTRI